MKNSKHLRLLAVLTILPLVSACGKKEPAPANTADLSMSEAEEPKAEAEAVAVNGPLELTLRVHKTRIKSWEESLWYQVSLRNLGKEDIAIFDKAFLRPSPVEMHRSAGISLWVTGPDGKVLKPSPRLGDGAVLMPGSPSWPIQEGDTRDKATQQQLIDTMWSDRATLRLRAEYAQGLRAKGVPEKEIDRRTEKFNEEHPLSDDGAKHKPGPYILLQPGASITNVASAREATSDPALPRGYTEFWGYWYTKPGKYRIKAAFDNRSSSVAAEYDKKHGIPPREDAVFVETKAIEFEVVP